MQEESFKIFTEIRHERVEGRETFCYTETMSALRPTETGGDLMPSTYAHRRFGADVLQQLPAALQDQIGKNRALFEMCIRDRAYSSHRLSRWF